MSLIRVVSCVFLIASFSCKNKIDNHVVISGNMEPLALTYLTVENRDITNPIIVDTLFLDQKGRFNDTLSIQPGYYKIDAEELKFDVYLEPRFNLNIKIKADNNVEFKGKGAKENTYLFERQKKRRELSQIDNYEHFITLTEEEFVSVNDSIYSVYMGLLEESGIVNRNFMTLENNAMNLNRDYNLMGFEINKRMLTQETDYSVSTGFPIALFKIDINDPRLLKNPFFIPFLANNHYYFLKDKGQLYIDGKGLKHKKEDIDVAYIKKLDEVLTNQEIKNKATYLIAKWNIVDIDSLDTFYKTFMEINTNNIFRNKISSIYSKLKDLNKVKAISSFKFLNNNQDTITLNDYKGKLIYMDIWASSCKPCIEEFPSFNELAEKFSTENVSFVGINIWDSEEKWRRQLKKHKLKGVQLKLLSKNQFENDFLSELNINSIPRYLILDSLGNILDFNADVPSSKKINQELSDLLEENNS